MKEKELRERAECGVCGKKIGESGLPMFWTVKIERHGVNMDTVKRQSGFAMAMGNAMLASVMGPDEEMTTPLMDPVDITVCETCAMKEVVIGALALE